MKYRIFQIYFSLITEFLTPLRANFDLLQAEIACLYAYNG